MGSLGTVLIIAVVLLIVIAAVLYLVEPEGSGDGVDAAEAHRALLRRLRKIEIVASRKASDQLAGEYHSVFKGRGMSFDEVRLYQPGDEVRFIDWNVSARSNDVYVKRFVEERELTVMLMVDASASLRFGSKGQTKRDMAVELAALIAFSAVKNNDRVGLILFTDTVERYVPPKKGRKHVMRLVTEILSFEPKGRGTNLEAPLELLSRVMHRHSIAFMLSDFPGTTTGAEPWLRSMRVVGRRHDLVPVVIRDGVESELPNLGLMLLDDLETGAPVWVDTGSRAVREAYRQGRAQAQASLLQRFRKMKIDPVDIETGSSYIKALVQFFHVRSRRR